MGVVLNGTDQLKSLVKIFHDLSVAGSIEELSAISVSAVRTTSGSDGASIVFFRDNTCICLAENNGDPVWRDKIFCQDECFAGEAVHTQKVVIIEDTVNASSTRLAPYVNAGVRSMFVVPLVSSVCPGAIECYWSQPLSFDDQAIETLRSLAGMVTMAFENLQLKTALEKQVNERTHELEQANKSLEVFSYSVSHDLQAPLRGINGFLGCLIDEHSKDLSHDAKYLVNKTILSVRQMSELIDRLLEFSRTANQELITNVVSTKRVVEKICEDIRRYEKERDITFDIAELPDAQADPVLICQVWKNLISNAVKYTSNTRKAVIEIGFTDEGSALTYFVKDNGRGFDMKYYDKLFRVFHRLHPQSEFPGTGVGLAIAAKIISRHGGRIYARSAPDTGATFYFMLPKTLS